jgi:hypothetical protein
MTKVMTLRYAAKCRVCQKEIPAGTRAVWHGKKQGSSHVECANPPQEGSGNLPAQTVFDYADLRRDYISAYGEKASQVLRRQFNETKWNQLSRDRERDGNWSGSTNAEMRNWLDNGYLVPGLDGVDSTLIPGAPKRKLRFAEEGDEMLIDLAWSGVDEHFITWDKRYTKPSLEVKINISFSAIVPARIINSYQSWVARMLQTIDQFGLDMQVDLISPGIGQMQAAAAAKHTVVIRVKKSGEASDFANWSPMFSPGGFRQMTFLAIVQSADLAGSDVSHGLGRPVDSNEWAVKYDSDTNVLAVTNNNDGSDFPEFHMTQSLIAILSSINHS